MEFKLRAWRDTDLESLVKYANNPNIAGNLTNAFPHPYTVENGQAFIQYARSADPLSIFAIELNGEAIGGIGIHPQTDIMCKNAELGYWLAEPFWGKGIISSAIAQIVQYAFATFDIVRIYARPFGTNFASQKALEKNGFVLEARIHDNIFKNGVFQDELIYAVRKPQTPA